MQPWDDLDEQQLVRAVVRDEPLLQQLAEHKQTRAGFTPIYKHPLPFGEERFDHEALLRRLTVLPVHKRAQAAVNYRNAWVLEQMYMDGVPVDLPDGKSNYRPLHIAASHNSVECVQVLLNIGVDVNSTTVSGFTPLFMAVSNSATQCIEILREHGAVLETDESSHKDEVGRSYLAIEIPAHPTYIDSLSTHLNVPHPHTTW